MHCFVNSNVSALFCASALAIFISSCSPTGQSNSVTGATTVTVTASSLYSDFKATPSATIQASWEATAKMSIAEYYESLVANSSNATIWLAGRAMEHPLSNLTSVRSEFLALGETYPTIGAYWAANGISPQGINEASIDREVAEMAARGSSAKASLSLQADNPNADYCKSIYPYRAFANRWTGYQLESIGAYCAAHPQTAANSHAKDFSVGSNIAGNKYAGDACHATCDQNGGTWNGQWRNTSKRVYSKCPVPSIGASSSDMAKYYGCSTQDPGTPGDAVCGCEMPN